MTTPTVAELLGYANLQMAAEAFLTIGKDPATGTELEEALTRGNERASRFTSVQATQFLDEWDVLAQHSTNTGFSGTVFRRGEGANAEYVLSFRSTEFLDDCARRLEPDDAAPDRPARRAICCTSTPGNSGKAKAVRHCAALGVTGKRLRSALHEWAHARSCRQTSS
ncbi:hypothetical protein [Derxia lacustris]|uniref:hypothetical protein n=1 Tax=Derxia lacustris TaxID=764842 RepID=UPI00111C3BF7|nr:hypothetical protein [Derxia lacustris]